MKLLHTSDWFLGKKFEGKCMIAYQKAILDEIAQIAATKNVDVVVVAGGVFDAPTPTAETLGVFFDAVEKITLGGERAMVICAGKNDNVVLLNSFMPLAKRFNLAIYTDVSTIVDIDINAGYRVSPTETGRGYIAFKNEKDEKIVVACVPYSVIFNKNDDISYERVVDKCLDTVSRRFADETINVVVGQLDVFSAGVITSDEQQPVESEQLIDECVVSSDIFPPNSTYIALGGKTSATAVDVDKNAYYSGAIQSYNFDDEKMDKSVIVASIDDDGSVRKENIKLKNCKKLKRVRCATVDDAKNQLEKYYEYLVELTLSTPEPLKSEQIKLLTESYANIFQLNLQFASQSSKGKFFSNMEKLSDKELFKSFYNMKMNEQAPQELLELFLEIMEGNDDEADIS